MDRMSIRAALADALSFVLPVDCAGCGLEDVSLCEPCRCALAPTPRMQRLDDGTPVWSGVVFEGPVAGALRALKEDARTSMARELGPALAAAAHATIELGGDARVVPVPTSRAAFRRRGYRVAELLARRAGLRPVRALRTVGTVADQRSLGRDDRRTNVVGSMTAGEVAGWRVLVVDDVVTTGATLREAVRTLEAAGARVIGAATVAATPRRAAS